MFEQWDAPAPTQREQLLADLRRRMQGVAPAAGDVPLAPLAPMADEPSPIATGVFPVAGPLAAILPAGGLPRGGVVSLSGGTGTTSLLLTLLAGPGQVWRALVGMPGIGLLAAAELGVDLDRTVLVPDPGSDVLQVLSILTDGMDLIAVAPPAGGFTAPARLRVLTGRLRQRGAVLLVAGAWAGADLVLRSSITGWSGIENGHGRLRDRELTVQVRGRGAAGRPRTATVLLRSTRTGVVVEPLTPIAIPVVPAIPASATRVG